MKKIVLLILAFALIFSSAFMLNITATAQTVSTCGDANGDGVTNILDLVRLKKYIASPSDTEIDVNAADLNGDSVIDATDLVCLRRLLLGIDEFVGGAGWPTEWTEALSQLE